MSTERFDLIMEQLLRQLKKGLYDIIKNASNNTPPHINGITLNHLSLTKIDEQIRDSIRELQRAVNKKFMDDLNKREQSVFDIVVTSIEAVKKRKLRHE